MKHLRIFSTGALFILLGTTVPTYAKPAGQGQASPVPLWKKKLQARGHQQGPPQNQAPQMYPHSRQEPRWSRDGHRGVWQEHRARYWQSEHRDWHERGGYQGYRIPEPRYRVQFGPTHMFRLSLYPVGLVSGYVHFHYGGFGFSVVDPLPEYWSENWYDDDDVYIADSEDGYYLHNRRYPQDRIAISVTIR